ncbi:MAG: DUF3108 domain-containing protein [Bacteroidota bacterium]
MSQIAKKTVYTSLALLITSFSQATDPVAYRHMPNTSFGPGESLTYRVHYGWLDAGVATLKVDNQLHTVNGRSCYKIDVKGKARGLLNLFLKMKNHFGSYIDTQALVSQGFYRYVQEGSYRKNERVHFDHAHKLAIVEQLDEHTQELRDTVTHGVTEHIQDIVSSWYTLRALDLGQIEVGDVLSIPVFFDDILYKAFQIRFLGRQRVKIQGHVFDTLVFEPIIPFASASNSIFASEHAITLFLSDDANKIPIKIKCQLLVGAVEVDLVKYKGLIHKLATP